MHMYGFSFAGFCRKGSRLRHEDECSVLRCAGRTAAEKNDTLENGQVEHLRIKNKKGIGIRTIKGGVWSFCSITSPESFDQIKRAIDDSVRDARCGTKDRIDLYPERCIRIQD